MLICVSELLFSPPVTRVYPNVWFIFEQKLEDTRGNIVRYNYQIVVMINECMCIYVYIYIYIHISMYENWDLWMFMDTIHVCIVTQILIR